MDFRILGPVEVEERGEVLAIGQGNQRALLALLALRSGEVVSSDVLIDELWDGRPPATAAKSLQVYVSRLRKALGDRVIVTQPPGYKLDVEQEQVDLFRFERLVADARNQSPADAATTLRDALAHWRGPALADVAGQPFAQREIARLDELRLNAIEDKIEADLSLGRHGRLVAELEGLVRQHPYRERLRAQLMLALYRSGRQADALAAYRDARATLADELGLEPSPDLRALEHRILSQDSGLDVAPEMRAPAAGPQRKSRWAVAAAGLASLAVAAGVGVALARNDDAPPVVAAANSVAVIDPATNTVVGAIPVGERPSDIAISGDDVWVLHPDRSTITHLSRTAREVAGTVGIGGAPSDLAAEPRGVWVSDAITGAVTLVEREHLVPTKKISTRRGPLAGPFPDAGHIAAGFGSLWVASGDGVITRIDLGTDRIASRIPGVETGQSEGGMAIGAGSIWVAGPFQESPVTRIDPRRNAVEVLIPLQKFRASGIAFGQGGVWVSDVGSDQVWRIDASRNSPSGSTKVGLGPIGVVYGAGSVWVANSGDGTVSRIDPVTARVVQVIEVGGSPNGLAGTDDAIWVTVA